ncbi:MAG: hypothetical protein QM278_01635 [Pseudomonadota bacterium]|nr:hypothetical protein [Pseudomonadota bacterium]
MKIKVIKSLGFIAVALAVVFLASGVQAGTQSVVMSPGNLSLGPGQTGEITLSYNVTSGPSKTTGLGIRICYDSRVIEKISIEDPYGEGLVAVDAAPVADSKNIDEVLITDQHIGAAWVGVAGDWPAMMKLPVQLGKIVVKVRADAEAGKTTVVKITASGLPVGYTLDAGMTTIVVK